MMSVKIHSSNIPAVKIIDQFNSMDHRGAFTKTFHWDSLMEQGIQFELRESFYSISKKDVIRGLHFHKPPFDHAKIVFCSKGAILDVALDLRTDSATYGQHVMQELSAENHLAMYIPRGFAHGFLSLEEESQTFYFVDGVYDAASDTGILYRDAGINWPVENPILSERDLSFPSIHQFQSPF
ncbi:MAG: dTDP-4-dehydrorhamnose 3,5-epimerase family protein [Chitinophagaceae bacterium]|jgi:dTDP-4-dehydrorhamnose 3,5-epimerase